MPSTNKKDRDIRVYLDLEYIYPGMTRKKGRPTSADQRQIVQIAAIIFDNEKSKELASFDVLTFPAFTKKLPSFFIELTEITQKELKKKGIPLSKGLQRLADFANNFPVWTFSLDQEVLEQNYAYLNISFPFKQDFTRVKLLLPKWNIDPEKYSSGTLFKAVGLEMSGQIHNALHDVRSMARAVHILEKKFDKISAKAVSW